VKSQGTRIEEGRVALNSLSSVFQQMRLFSELCIISSARYTGGQPPSTIMTPGFWFATRSGRVCEGML
jgi:hypothetical protein